MFRILYVVMNLVPKIGCLGSYIESAEKHEMGFQTSGTIKLRLKPICLHGTSQTQNPEFEFPIHH